MIFYDQLLVQLNNNEYFQGHHITI